MEIQMDKDNQLTTYSKEDVKDSNNGKDTIELLDSDHSLLEPGEIVEIVDLDSPEVSNLGEKELNGNEEAETNFQKSKQEIVRITFSHTQKFKKSIDKLKTAISNCFEKDSGVQIIFEETEESLIVLDESSNSIDNKNNELESPDKKYEFLFKIDTTPSTVTNFEEIPSYNRSAQNVLSESSVNNLAKSTMETSFTNSCFNCSSHSHMLRECPEERNIRKIRRAKKGLSSRSERYHADVEQRFDHLKPGQLSENLRKAFNLRRKEVPKLFYKMRVLGYPPGWLEDAKVSHSGISLIDSQSNRVNDQNAHRNKGQAGKHKYDVSKIIRFPGFNTSPGPNYRDEYKYHKVPRMSENQDIEKFIENFGDNVVKGYRKKQLQNLPKTDNDKRATGITEVMDLEAIDLIDDDDDSKKLLIVESDLESKSGSESPTLQTLQEKHKMLLSELENDPYEIDEDIQEFVKGVAALQECEESEIVDVGREQNPEANKEPEISLSENIIDPEKPTEIKNLDSNHEDSIREQEINLTTTQKGSSEPENNATSPENSQDIEMKETVFDANLTAKTTNNSNMVANISSSIPGTPIIQFSPYDKLPNFSEFSKGVSDVIYFENLPHSTGNYKQMKKVLQKVRQTISKLNEDDC